MTYKSYRMLDVSPQIHFAPTITPGVHNAPYSFRPKSILHILQQNTITPQHDSLHPKVQCITPQLLFYYARESSKHVKPQSDIHCNRSATSPRPKFKTIAEVAEESQLGFAVGRRLIGDWLPTDRRLVGDLVGTSLRLDATGRRPVGDWSPTSRRPVADQVNLKLI